VGQENGLNIVIDRIQWACCNLDL